MPVVWWGVKESASMAGCRERLLQPLPLARRGLVPLSSLLSSCPVCRGCSPWLADQGRLATEGSVAALQWAAGSPPCSLTWLAFGSLQPIPAILAWHTWHAWKARSPIALVRGICSHSRSQIQE